MKPPKVSIIIPTLNEEMDIGRLLDSVNNATYPNKEVIIVDGGSKDRTVGIAKSKGAKVVPETGKIRCPANAKNIGAKNASGQILLYLDADTYSISKNFILDGTKQFDNTQVVGVVPDNRRRLNTFWSKALYHSRTLIPWSKKLILTRKTTLKANEISWFPNFIRRETFFKIGGYSLDGLEDQGFLRRYKEYSIGGLRTIYVEKCALYSQEPETLSDILKQTKWYSRVIIPSIKQMKKKYMITFLASILQPLFFISIFLVPIHTIFLVLSIPYILKLIFMTLYTLLFKGATYNSKYYVWATIPLDLLSFPWKLAGVLEYFMKAKKTTLFSRGK